MTQSLVLSAMGVWKDLEWGTGSLKPMGEGATERGWGLAWGSGGEVGSLEQR